jgi:hypothetical protein
VPEDELGRWAGTYHFASPRHQLFAFLMRTAPALEVQVEGGRLYIGSAPRTGRVELIPLGGDRFRLARASGSHIALGRDHEGRRVLVAEGAYFVEEPRWRSLAFVFVPLACVWLLATGVLLPIAVFRRRPRPSPGFGWPLCASLSFFAMPRLFLAADAARALGEANVYTVGIFVLSIGFAVGSLGSAVQALAWLPRPTPLAGKLYRLLFALAACSATVYLAAYGVIGIRLWSY